MNEHLHCATTDKAARFGLWALLLALFACSAGDARVSQSSYPAAGLFTPGSLLGASDPTDNPMAMMSLGNRCQPLGVLDAGMAAGTATEGVLSLEFETRPVIGRYRTKNCTVAWLENQAGQYVATIEISAALRKPGLIYWQDRACTDKYGPDVVSGATRRDHESVHMATWKGLDLDGKPVPDGTYQLYIEVAVSDKEPSEFAVFEVVKGAMPSAFEPPLDEEGPLLRVAIEWSPGAE